MSCSSAAQAGAEYEHLVARLIATPATRLALPNATSAERASLVQKAFEDSVVRTHFSDHCVFVSCDSTASTEVTTACIASGLGLEPSEHAIVNVLEEIAAHDRTLIVLDNVDAIYLPTDTEQQEATNVLLATLASVDGLTLVITFCGIPLPECVAWTSTDNSTNDRLKPGSHATNLAQHLSTPAAASSAQIHTTETDHILSALEATHSAVPDDVLVPSSSATTVTGSDNTSCQDQENRSPQILTRPRTIAQSKVPPPKPTVFHGRDKEVERLIACCMVPCTAPIGIVGPGGIGKTTLALKVLHDPRVKQCFGRQRFFLTCEGANSVDEVLAQLASKLEIQRSHDVPLWPALLDNLRSRQRVLVLLDNFESIWSPTNDELREASEVFLAQLAVLDELTLLVTTRGNLLHESFTWANVDTAELETLSSNAARLTFTDLSYLEPHVLESESEANALTKLLREIDFMPLAITLLARLDDLPSRLLREWSEHYTAVLEADHHDGTRRELSVEVSIKISLAHLPAESANFRPRQLLSVMGQLPAGLFPGISIKLRPTIPNSDLAAQELLRHSLVYTGGHGELRMLSPVRYYVCASIPMSAATLSAVDEIYTSIARANPPAERSDVDGPAYDVELPNMFQVLATGLDRRSDLGLVDTILELAAYCGNRNQPCLQLLQKLAPRVQHSRPTKANFLLAIAVHYKMTGELHLAVQSAEQSAELCAELEEKALEAAARIVLFGLFLLLGRSEDSNKQYAAAQELMRESQLSVFEYRIRPNQGDDIVLAEQRFRADREVHLRAGDGFAFARMSDLILELVRERGDLTAFIKELEYVVMLGDQMQPASGSQWLVAMKVLLAGQYLECGIVDGVEDLLIEAYALQSQFNDSVGLARVAHVLATLYKTLHRFSEGVELMEAAARYYGEAGITTWAAQCEREATEMRTQMRTVTLASGE